MLCLEIHKKYDWLFVLDVDEYIVPLGYQEPDSRWCDERHPSIISIVIESMVQTVSRLSHMHTWWDLVASRENHTRGEVAQTTPCLLGSSFDNKNGYCRAFTSLELPVYLWLRDSIENSSESLFPTIRSKFPAPYVFTVVNVEPFHNQRWKSVYQTRYNPLLNGETMHFNHGDTWPILVPRKYHGGMTLELAHNRMIGKDKLTHVKTKNLKKLNLSDESKFVHDTRMMDFSVNYSKCMMSLLK